jgi:hypothetical protein
MCALSDDTRQFLRNSRIMTESSENGKLRNSNPSLDSGLLDSPRLRRKPLVKKSQPGKKTLREIAIDQRIGKGHVPLAHASSEPSLFAGNFGNELHNSKSSSDINSNSDASSNVELLAQAGSEQSRTNSPDPFLELISQRHKPQQNVGQRNGTPWFAKFE